MEWAYDWFCRGSCLLPGYAQRSFGTGAESVRMHTRNGRYLPYPE